MSEGGVASTASVVNTALTGGDATGDFSAGGGYAGNVGGAGKSGTGESDLASSDTGGVEMGEAGDGVAGFGGDGSAINGGVSGQDKGERISSLSTSKSLSNSTLLRRFLFFLLVGFGVQAKRDAVV
jgi:hypothetical protein